MTPLRSQPPPTTASRLPMTQKQDLRNRNEVCNLRTQVEHWNSPLESPTSLVISCYNQISNNSVTSGSIAAYNRVNFIL